MITGVVLAGGRASRLGGEKLGIRLGDQSLLELAVAAVASVSDELVIAGPRPAGAFEPRVPTRFVEDVESFPGPLAALASALGVANGDRAIVVAGDMPFLVPAVLAALLERLAMEPAIDAAFLGADGEPKRQVLPLAVRAEPVLASARQALAEGDRSLVRLVDRVGGVAIPASDWRVLDAAGRTLVDIDEPGDLLRFGDAEFP